MNIFQMPLYYISFNKNPNLEKNLELSGFKDINHFEAVDGRKFQPAELLSNKLITIRTYTDLITEREQHSGIPSLGAIGCTMSHDKLWNLCIDKNLPYIIICEDDMVSLDLNNKKVQEIETILSRPKSIFIGTKVKKRSSHKKIVNTVFMGLQFYIVSIEACKELVKDTFPIDVQTDWYIAHLDTIGRVNVNGTPLASQSVHNSSIQDLCVKCFLPNKTIYYVILAVVLLGLLLWRISLHRRLKSCNDQLTKLSSKKRK